MTLKTRNLFPDAIISVLCFQVRIILRRANNFHIEFLSRDVFHALQVSFEQIY